MSGSRLCQWSLFFTWLVALAALFISQYASDILNFPVCHLCWYQRIFTYPLVIIVGIAAFRNDGGIAIYTIPLTLLGALFALYQYLEQMIPNFSPIATCQQGPDCSAIHIKLLGFITFPLASLFACLTMTALLFIAHFSRKP